jgi:hypothetical protein
LFTSFGIAAKNVSTNITYRLRSVTVEGLVTRCQANIDFSGKDKVAVSYNNPGNANGNNTADYSFTFNDRLVLSSTLTDIATRKSAENDRQYFIAWPMTAPQAEQVKITLDYEYRNANSGNWTNPADKTLTLSADAWEAGKKNNVNLLFKDKEIVLQCIVMDWIPNEETIDFSDQVSVRARMEWSNVISNSNGEVILYNDAQIEAVCDFHIETPRGATWTASLIPVEGHLDVFEFVGGTANGAVGVDSQLRLTVTNQAPIAPRHICILRITVQTADGRTIVVKNLVPGKEDAEFRIIQNLING